MSEPVFEIQECGACHKFCFCVLMSSLEKASRHKIKQKFLCERCLEVVYMSWEYKDRIRKMMIECGIEDLEPQI